MKVSIGKYKKNGTERNVSVKIDYWDTWNMETTLGLIILPMLLQLKETKHGYPIIDDTDGFNFENTGVPEENRWDVVLDEMIWAFTNLNNPDAEDEFYENSSFKLDEYKAYLERMQRAFCLFGKYYQALWT